MSNKAVRKLHQDISHLHKAQNTRAHDSKEVRQDNRALKTDQKQLKRARDQFDKHKDSLGTSRDNLSSLKDMEKMLLAPLGQELGQLQQAYAASVDPATGQGDATLQAQIAGLGQLESDLKGMVDPQVAAAQTKVQSLADQVQKGRLSIRQGKKDITHDKKDLKHDTKALAHAKSSVKADRKKALEDLKPAEYQMGLKATNSARKELGLKKVDHVIRQGPGNVTSTMKRLAAAGKSVAMSMGGYVSGGLCATGVSAAIQRATGIKVWGNGNQIDDNLPKSKFKQIHIPLAKALKIPGLILTWEHTSTAAGSIYGHTAITTGDGHSSCSDFIERDTLAGNRSRTGLKIFMPIS